MEFYENRIRRILPALTVMILAVMAVYYVMTSHIELLPVQRSVKRAIVGLANFYFYSNSGYFDQAAETMPLLHTWSLGVEEQFYFIMPALIFLLYKKFNNTIKIVHVLLGLLTISFIMSLFFVYYNKDFAFYMLPTRAWELLLGSVLAYTAWTPKSQRGKFICTLIGFTLILTPVFLYDNTILFPGFWALPSCIGACLYIAGGTDAKHSLLHYITYNKVLLFIGLISYSLYLWHWPIFVFYQTFPFYTNISTLESFMLSLLAVFIAAVSWKFIENPFRYNPFFKNRKIIWTIALVCIGGMLYLGSALRYTTISVIYKYTTPIRITEYNPDNKREKLDFLIIGDSHALSLTNIVKDMAAQYNLYGLYQWQMVNNCYGKKTDAKKIAKFENEWKKLAEIYETHTVNTVIFVYRLTEKLLGKDIYYNKFSPEDPAIYTKNPKLSPSEALYQGLKDGILQAKENGVKHIYFQLPVPEPKAFVPQKASVLNTYYGYKTDEINKMLGESTEEYLKRNQAVLEILNKLKKEFPNIRFIDPTPYFLDKTQTHYIVINATDSYYYDDDHPSVEGSLLYKSSYENILSELAKQ